MKIIYFLYDWLFLAAFIMYLPVYFFKKKISYAALKEKLGFFPACGSRRTIWIQVVSVGEVILIESFLKRLREVFDDPLVISTTTLTGNSLARQRYSNLARVIFFPLDVSWIMRKAISLIQPKLFIAVETELWPQCFRCLKQQGVPIVVINGRISDQAFRRYRRVRSLIKPPVSSCTFIGAQNQAYAERFSLLGARAESLVITGNLKFESINVDERKLAAVREKYHRILKPSNNLLLIAASTHAPEEEILIEWYRSMPQVLTDTVLLLAPRHPTRVPMIEKMIRAKGFLTQRLSVAVRGKLPERTVFILDTVGELLYLYGIADVCFVGGSLSGDGGHNILEPIYFLKPTVFGPSMENFTDIEEKVLKMKAGIKIKDPAELKRILQELLQDECLRAELRSRCLAVFEAGKNVLEHNIQLVLRSLRAL